MKAHPKKVSELLHGNGAKRSTKVFAELFSKSDHLRPQAPGVSFVSFSLRLFLQRKAANDKHLKNGYTLINESVCMGVAIL